MKLDKEYRTRERLERHYEIERELADKLRRASRDDRKHMYTHLYDELFARVPDHPQLINKADSEKSLYNLKKSFSVLNHFLLPDSTFLEIGAGDCALSLQAAKVVKDVYAVDVSKIITQDLQVPDNFHLIISDGCGIDLPNNSVDVAYSDQLMEHLHPDDAIEQLGNIYRVLKPGGKYLCITPNRVFGPHDISKYFDEVATGFHLKEYTISELAGIFRTVGFSDVKRFLSIRGYVAKLPLFPAITIEKTLFRIPYSKRRRLARYFRLRYLLGGENIKLIATK